MLDEIRIGGVRERLLQLRSMPTLAGLDEEGYAILASHTIERIFQPGDVIVREDEPMRSGFLVVEGMVEVRRQGYLTVAVDRGGVGFLSLLAKDPRGVEAIATKRTRTLELPVEALYDAYEENFSFMRNAIRLVAGGILDRRSSLPRREDEGQDAPLGEWYQRPKTLVEKVINATERAVIMRGANIDAILDWARSSQEIRVEPGHRFWSAGDLGAYSLMIDYGRVRCTAPDGRATVVGHQYVLGALDTVCNRPLSYGAVAETPVIGFRLERDDWMTVLENHRRLGTNLLGILAKQLLHLQLEDAKKREQPAVTAA